MSSRKQSMRIGIIITFALMVCLVHSNPVEATAPDDVQLTYDFDAQTLTVNVSHYSPSTKNHYIEKIEILKNGFSILNRSYENQSFSWGMYDTFSVSAVLDDNLTVTTLCSKGYSLTRWVVVSSTTSTSSTPTDTTTPTETTSPTQPTNGLDSPGTTLDAGVAIAAGVVVVLFLIIFFAWLNPDRVPESFKQLGARVRSRIIWLGEKMSGLLQQLKTRLPSK